MANHTLTFKLVDDPNEENMQVHIDNSENIQTERFIDMLDYLVFHLTKDRNKLIRKFIQKEVSR